MSISIIKLVFIQDANFAKLSSAHFYAGKRIKTVCTAACVQKAAYDAIKFTDDQAALAIGFRKRRIISRALGQAQSY